MTAAIIAAAHLGVLAWLPSIHEARAIERIPLGRYSDATLLALLHVESFPKGCATSQRPGSQFRGGFQLSLPYALDAGFESREAATTDPTTQVRAVLRFMERYAAIHLYQPSRVALLHKLGPRAMQRGDTHAEYADRFDQAFTIYVRWVVAQNDALRACSTQYQGGFDGWLPVPCT